MPMLLMGDEVRRTQHGNNNAYCHDDESTWFDWSLLERHADVLRFVSILNARRQLRGMEHELQRLSLNEIIHRAIKSWHGVRLNQPDWSVNSHSIALSVELRHEQMRLYLMFNAFWHDLEFELPEPVSAGRNPWRRWIDTALDSPYDICDWRLATPVEQAVYPAHARSVVALWSHAK
jgi:glycogen operon protein